jgi:Fe2+ or Zn2+ uptake regulation protein
MPFRKRESIEKMILSYLDQNPDAADTIEGVTKFWLKKENAKITFSVVSRTLDKLQKKGIIQAFQGADGTTYYKLKKDQPEREQTVH